MLPKEDSVGQRNDHCTGAVEAVMRQFLAPWTVEALDGGFKIVDAIERRL
jgi:hypothetical protein